MRKKRIALILLSILVIFSVGCREEQNGGDRKNQGFTESTRNEPLQKLKKYLPSKPIIRKPLLVKDIEVENVSWMITCLECDNAGNLYVGTRDNFKIYSSDLMLLKEIGKKGNNKGEFLELCQIAVNANGDIVVADMEQKSIQVFDKNGTVKLMKRITLEDFFDSLNYFDIDSQNIIYARSRWNLYKLDLDGNTLGTIDLKKFFYPAGSFLSYQAKIDYSGSNIYVLDSKKNREITKFTYNGSIIFHIIPQKNYNTYEVTGFTLEIDEKENIYFLLVKNEWPGPKEYAVILKISIPEAVIEEFAVSRPGRNMGNFTIDRSGKYLFLMTYFFDKTLNKGRFFIEKYRI